MAYVITRTEETFPAETNFELDPEESAGICQGRRNPRIFQPKGTAYERLMKVRG